jgi:hypothetical protein
LSSLVLDGTVKSAGAIGDVTLVDLFWSNVVGGRLVLVHAGSASVLANRAY